MAPFGPFHRTGGPGGSGCPVSALPVKGKQPNGSLTSALLLDAGKESTELELLRTVARTLGVRWGHDELGWWAVVPNAEKPTGDDADEKACD